MSVTDNDMDPKARASWIPLQHSVVSPVAASTARPTFSVVPGFPFEVMRVQAWANTVTDPVTIDVKIGTASVLATPLTMVNGVDGVGTLATSKVARRGSSTAAVSLEYTNANPGLWYDGHFIVWIRAYPGSGEV